KPILLLNTDGFYTPLDQFLHKMADEHFLSKDHLNMWQLIDNPSDFWPALNSFPSWSDDSISNAQV
ncbi:MAG: LOG family protein, partial [Bacteroidales bacterium]|nr:LOG family protein [Bacteroidales bacterium]